MGFCSKAIDGGCMHFPLSKCFSAIFTRGYTQRRARARRHRGIEEQFVIFFLVVLTRFPLVSWVRRRLGVMGFVDGVKQRSLLNGVNGRCQKGYHGGGLCVRQSTPSPWQRREWDIHVGRPNVLEPARQRAPVPPPAPPAIPVYDFWCVFEIDVSAVMGSIHPIVHSCRSATLLLRLERRHVCNAE